MLWRWSVSGCSLFIGSFIVRCLGAFTQYTTISSRVTAGVTVHSSSPCDFFLHFQSLHSLSSSFLCFCLCLSLSCADSTTSCWLTCCFSSSDGLFIQKVRFGISCGFWDSFFRWVCLLDKSASAAAAHFFGSRAVYFEPSTSLSPTSVQLHNGFYLMLGTRRCAAQHKCRC